MYESRLERIGYRPECAKRIVADYTATGKLDELEDYLRFKESEKLSISEHVSEVLG